jgi:hypothetical protein
MFNPKVMDCTARSCPMTLFKGSMSAVLVKSKMEGSQIFLKSEGANGAGAGMRSAPFCHLFPKGKKDGI